MVEYCDEENGHYPDIKKSVLKMGMVSIHIADNKGWAAPKKIKSLVVVKRNGC